LDKEQGNDFINNSKNKNMNSIVIMKCGRQTSLPGAKASKKCVPAPEQDWRRLCHPFLEKALGYEEMRELFNASRVEEQ
jgi:hypothetical protein